MKLKSLLTWRINILIVCLILALIIIHPSVNTEGVIIKHVNQDSEALLVGMQSPPSETMPTAMERIISINNKNIKTIEDYSEIINSININETVRITTNKKSYDPFLKETDNLGITIDKVPSSNIRYGLDLAGGTRVVLKPDTKVSEQDLQTAKDSISNRLNVYGLSDINVKTASDLSGNRYIVIEVAGATQEEVRKLVSQQGKFEAKIGNETVFLGGQRDITFVCRNDGTCSGIRQCNEVSNGYNCRFEFAIAISPEAAERHASITKNLDINISQSGEQILSKTLDLYLDDKQVDSLQIMSSLKGSTTTNIAISGPGFASTRELAIEESLKNMNHLQTVLITGSLPFKLNIIKIDSISPSLGLTFLKNAFLTGLLAMLTVGIIIYIRYRRLKISIPIIITMLSEVFLTLGIAALLKYNLDLAAIAGIIAAVGTGVDDQIVITDEILKGKDIVYNWKEKIKRAFFIILTAYAATIASMLPLFRAGVGLLTGFAITTIVGVSVGILITRPAYASIIEKLIRRD